MGRLGAAYTHLLRLGGFLETDIRVQHDRMDVDGPLDADIHGLLTALVQTAAPWLQGFPTVAEWDDAAGKALVRTDMFQPAHEFVRIARSQETISAQDAAEMEMLAQVADTDGYQGAKARNRSVASATNLIITIGSMLAEDAAVGSTARTANDLRQALGSLIRAAQKPRELELEQGPLAIQENNRDPKTRTTFQVDETTLNALSELKETFGVRTNAQVIRKALAFARIAAQNADGKTP
jgi:hypothetical protein